MTHVVLLNAGAGSMSNDTPHQVRRHYEVQGVRAEVHVIEVGEDIGSAAARAVAGHPDVLVAGGGDGTVSAVAEAIVGRPIAFGVLPLGTLNHFARDAGIPNDLRTAVATTCNGELRDVDVGRVDDHLFVNNSSLGLYPRAVKKREQLTERLGQSKWRASMWAALSVLRRFPFLDVEVKTKRGARSYRTPLIFIGNNSYELHGMDIGERRRLDSGYLALYIVDSGDRWALARLAARALLGRLRRADDFVTVHASEAVVKTRRPSVVVATDGEVKRLRSPLVYRCEPRALRVLVPAAMR